MHLLVSLPDLTLAAVSRDIFSIRVSLRLQQWVQNAGADVKIWSCMVGYGTRANNFPNILEPPQNSGSHDGVMQDVPHWRKAHKHQASPFKIQLPAVRASVMHGLENGARNAEIWHPVSDWNSGKTKKNAQFYNLCTLSMTWLYLFRHCRYCQGAYTKIILKHTAIITRVSIYHNVRKEHCNSL